MKLYILLLLVIVPMVFLVDCNEKEKDKDNGIQIIYYLQYKPNPRIDGEGETQLCKKERGKETVLKRVSYYASGGGPFPRMEGPILSPDGEKRLFLTEMGYTGKILIINEKGEVIDIDNEKLPQVDNSGSATGDISPLWFPDSIKIAFCSLDFLGGRGVYVYDIKTSKVEHYLKNWLISDLRWYDPGKSILFEGSQNDQGKKYGTMLFDLKTLKTKLLIPRTR